MNKLTTLMRAWTSPWLLASAAILCVSTTASSQVSVTASVGNLGPTNYATVNAAFTAINAGTHRGVIDVAITGNTTEPGTPVPLRSSGTGSSLYTSITIRPVGNRVVSQTASAARSVFEFQGADNITVDGDDPLTAGERNLTIAQNGSAGGAGAVRFRSGTNAANSADGTMNCAVRNCVLKGGRTTAISTLNSYGVYMGTFADAQSAIVGSGCQGCTGITIENNDIQDCYYGVFVNGNTTTYPNDLVIRGNDFNSPAVEDGVAFRGIYLYQTQATASSNSVLVEGNRFDMWTTGTNNMIAIELANTNAGARIIGNRIDRVFQGSTSSTQPAYGIAITNATSNSGITIANNFVQNILHRNASGNMTVGNSIIVGVRVAVNVPNLSILHNTVSLTGANTNAAQPSYSACLQIQQNTITGGIVRNNIFSNTMTGAVGDSRHVTFWGTGNLPATFSNNCYNRTVSAAHSIAWTSGVARTTLANWNAGQAGSFELAPPFVSATDLHLDPAGTNASSFFGSGLSGTGITKDIDGDERQVPPGVGADEICVPSIDPESFTVCFNTGTTLELTGNTVGHVNYQWLSSSTTGAPYENTLGTASTQATGNLTAETFYVLDLTCALTGGPDVAIRTGEAVVSVDPLPEASAGGSVSICQTASAIVSGASSAFGTIQWTHDGSGSLSNATTIAPTYNAVAADAGNLVTLLLTVTSNNVCNPSTATAEYYVSVDPSPQATAGGSTTICQTGNATVSGATLAFGTPSWGHNGAGTLDDANTLTPTYNAAAGDAGNAVILTLTVTSNNACNPATAQAIYTVNVDPLPQASAGGSTTICETGSATVSGATLAFGTPAWGHDGAGTLDDANTLTPTYNAVAADANNAVVLTLTVTSNNTCAPTTAAPVIYTVNVDPLPAASAGGSTAICVDGSATVTGATASNGTILWTSDGVGSLDDDEELLPTYTPGLGDAGNDVVLTLTVTSNNACNAATDDATFTVTVNPLPVVDAGSIGPLCSVDPDFDLVGSPTGGVWTGTGVSGTGPYVFDPSVGTQTLAYIYTDGNGCTDSDDVSITVIPATTWYADQDGDGFGDPNTTQDACDQPSGYVANNTDNCPTVFGLQGDFCDADPDPNTFALGVLDSNCACTLLPPDLDVTLELRTPDGSSDNITWELVTDVGSQVVCSGGGYPSGITDPITAFCSIPNGCYRLRVQDESGDGVGFGPGGGYQLRLAGPNAQDIRIVDNLGNFSSGVLSAIGNGPAAICFPMASDPKPLYQHRDKLDFVSGQYLISEEDAAVSAVWNPAPNAVQSTNTGYEFWLFDPNGSYSYRRFRNHATSDGFGNVGATRACHMKVNGWFASQAAPANVLLNVRIRTRVNGVNGDWGPAYRFKIDPARAACPLTLLNDFPGNAFESCGQTRTWGGSTLIHARPVSGANRYQWRFRTVGEPLAPIIIRTSNTYFLTLNWTVNPLQPGKTYEVDVRASKTAGATWCTDAVLPALVDPWGTVCLLTIQGSNAQGGGQNLALENTNTNLSLYPNPNRGDQVMLSIDAVDEGVETISVDFFDLAGHRAVARTIPTQGNNLNSLLELNGLAAGVYIVHITAGDKVYTERLVVTQ
jgi:hypothetical protein